MVSNLIPEKWITIISIVINHCKFPINLIKIFKDWDQYFELQYRIGLIRNDVLFIKYLNDRYPEFNINIGSGFILTYALERTSNSLIVKSLLERGASLEYIDSIDIINLVCNNEHEKIQLLIDFGLDLNLLFDSGFDDGDNESISLLINHGADPIKIIKHFIRVTNN